MDFSWTGHLFRNFERGGASLNSLYCRLRKNFFPKNRNVVIYLGVTAVLSGLWKKEEGEAPPPIK